MNNPARIIEYLETESHGSVMGLRYVMVITRSELSDCLRKNLPDLLPRKSIVQLAIGIATTFTLALTAHTGQRFHLAGPKIPAFSPEL